MNIHKFIEWASPRFITFSPCNDPNFLSISVLDLETKKTILDNLDRYPEELRKTLEKDLMIEPSDLQYQQLKTYLKEFAERRNLTFSAFPKSFQDWMA
jgi:hypothetical protein